jgi:hypothetical protein
MVATTQFSQRGCFRRSALSCGQPQPRSLRHRAPDRSQDGDRCRPRRTEPRRTEPRRTEPRRTKPRRTKPRRTKPRRTKPRRTKPRRTKPRRTKPRRTKPRRTKPRRTKPRRTKPRRAKPRRTKPRRTEPRRTKPRRTNPRRTEPRRTEPRRTERGLRPVFGSTGDRPTRVQSPPRRSWSNGRLRESRERRCGPGCERDWQSSGISLRSLVDASHFVVAS